jgi:predicted ATP-grasp superfamily ATP-dependent carboligase
VGKLDCSIRVLITDGDERAALAAARSLRAAGAEVHVTARSRVSLAGVTAGVRGWSVRADPRAAPAEYAAAVARLAGSLGIELLLPVTDMSVEAILAHRDLLPAGVVVPYPPAASFRTASDKLRVLALARAAGFATPETRVLAAPSEAAAADLDAVLPGVVKPHRSLVAADGVRRQVGVAFVDDLAACRRALAALPRAAFPVLVQRRVRGPGEGLFALRWKGEVVAVFAHRRLREKPPAGGVSVYRESIAPGFRLLRAGMRLLDALDWGGVAMIECKRDLETGRHVIMEVNARLWGSLQLAIDAGVDFPVLLARCALGLPVPPRTKYRLGVRSRWLWGDLDHLLLRLRRSAVELHLDAGAPSRLATVRAFFTFVPSRDRCEVWRWRDPLPFLLETARRLHLAPR